MLHEFHTRLHKNKYKSDIISDKTLIQSGHQVENARNTFLIFKTMYVKDKYKTINHIYVASNFTICIWHINYIEKCLYFLTTHSNGFWSYHSYQQPDSHACTTPFPERLEWLQYIHVDTYMHIPGQEPLAAWVFGI